MFWIVLGVTVAVAIAVCVLAMVAIPALRSRRSVLTPRGERVFNRASENAAAVKKVGAVVKKAPTPPLLSDRAPRKKR